MCVFSLQPSRGQMSQPRLISSKRACMRSAVETRERKQRHTLRGQKPFPSKPPPAPSRSSFNVNLWCVRAAHIRTRPKGFATGKCDTLKCHSAKPAKCYTRLLKVIRIKGCKSHSLSQKTHMLCGNCAGPKKGNARRPQRLKFE